MKTKSLIRLFLIPAILVTTFFVSGTAAQNPPCSNKWFEIRPDTLIAGPIVTPGRHRIWVGAKVDKTGAIVNWTKYGPFPVVGGKKYLAIIQNGVVYSLLENDVKLNSYSTPTKDVAVLYYENKPSDGRTWYAICSQRMR